MKEFTSVENVDVLKVGTNTLVKKYEDGTQGLDLNMFKLLGRQASGGGEKGHKVIVSSGNIAAGLLATSTKTDTKKGALLYERAKITRPNNYEMIELQRLSSIGSRHILNAWARHILQKEVGGLLLTRNELGQSETREEAMQTIHALLRHNEVPIVNENDSISHEQIAFGDNDTLAATLAVDIAKSRLFTGRVRLFLVTDVVGVCVDKDDPTTRIPVIENTDDYRHLALDTEKEGGTGGMATKFDAADICKAGGVDMWIYNGMRHLNYAVRGNTGTYFPAGEGDG